MTTVSRPITNIRVLSPSRKRRRAGDIFALQVRDGEYLFGRLVSTEARVGGFPNCHLIYIYKTVSSDKKNIPELKVSDILLPPIAINQKPWTLGYFECVGYRPLQKSDLLDRHCFFDGNKYFDERGEEIPRPHSEPISEDALHSYRSFDDVLSIALELPLAAA